MRAGRIEKTIGGLAGRRIVGGIRTTAQGLQARLKVAVKSKMRSNGTQSVIAFIQEDFYDTKSGDTSIKETVYQEAYATFFKRDPEHKGMLLMISPQNGSIEAVVEVCEKKK